MLKNVSTWLNCIKRVFNYLIVLGIGIYIGYSLPSDPKIITIEDTKEKIIRDSIYIVNDSIKVIINNIEKEYAKEDSMLSTFDDSAHVSFFTRYIEDYNRTYQNSK